MLPPSGVSRRVLVAGAALAAVASTPSTEARKRKSPPLAFYSVTMTGVRDFASGSDRAFIWDLSGAVCHPTSDTHFPWGGTLGAAATLSTKEARAQIIKQLQGHAQSGLQSHGQGVPADRIDVILI